MTEEPPGPGPIPETASRPRRRLLRVALRLGLLLLLLLIGFLLWVRLACFAEPPELGADPPVVTARLERGEDGTLRLGRSWFQRRPGCSLLHVEGDPFTMGYANAKLTAELLTIQESALLDVVHQQLSSLTFAGVALAVLVNNRRLPDFVRRDIQLEILGLSRGSDDPFPQYGPRYHRILNYHAAHDIAHWVWGKGYVGCTGFAARATRTATGHLMAARNFDFEAGAHFDVNKIIGRYRPDRGLAFLSVAWPGMAGAVTGINEERIYCSINAATSSDLGRIGTPVSLVVRDVLQFAHSLDEAVAIIRAAKVFVSDSYLVADGESGDAVVVEKTPERCAVRGMDDDLILQSNHFETDELAADPANREAMRSGTSVPRHRRLAELLAGSRPIGVEQAVAILRDRCGVGGEPLPTGDRDAIDALIATHSVVADVTGGVLWVSRGPHTLGTYEGYSIEGFGAPAVAGVDDDPFLVDGRWERWSLERESAR